MLTDPATLTNSTTLSQQPSKGNTELGKTEFLKLLTTQLANQDPTEPMDNTEFVAQLAQFSSLEGLTNLGEVLENILTVSAADNAANAVTLIGKSVRHITNELNGPGEIFYQTSGKADKVTVSIKNEDGTVVKTIQGLKGSGELQSLEITGLEEGKYTIEVAAEDANGDQLQAMTTAVGYVTGVSYEGGAPILQLDSGQRVSTGNVIEIRVPHVAQEVSQDDSPESNGETRPEDVGES